MVENLFKSCRKNLVMSEEKVRKILSEVKDPETGDPVTKSMVKDLKIDGKKVALSLVPPMIGCAGCGLIAMMVSEIEEKLKKKGYEVEVTVKGF